MKSRTRAAVALAALLSLAAPFACTGRREPGRAAAAGPESGAIDNLVVAVPLLPETLDPMQTISQAMYRVSSNIFNTLIGFDFRAGGGLVPQLAESWRQIDNRTLEVKLRPGVAFQNGDELSAEDVVYTFGAGRMAGGGGTAGSTKARGYWSLLDRVEAVDRYTVRFHSSEPDPVMARRLTLPAFQIVCSRAGREAKSRGEWARQPVGTGPFRVREFIPSEQLVLEAHPGYWGGRPAVGTVTFLAVPDVAARVAGLLAGEYHIIAEVPPDMFGPIESEGAFTVEGGPIDNFRGVYFNMHQPYFDVYLRRAMSLAIDRELIVRTLFEGRTVVPNGLQQKGYGDMYIAEHPYPRYDLAQARELVRRSAYRGETIPYPVLNDYYVNEIETARILVEMWQAAGINVQIEVKENWPQVDRADARGVRQLGLRNTSFTDLYMDPVGCLWRTFNPEYDAQKYHNWQAAEFNRWGRVLETSFSLSRRREAFRKMLEYFDADPPAVILHQNVTFCARPKALDWSVDRQVYMYFGPENFRQ